MKSACLPACRQSPASSTPPALLQVRLTHHSFRCCLSLRDNMACNSRTVGIEYQDAANTQFVASHLLWLILFSLPLAARPTCVVGDASQLPLRQWAIV